ncbi:MAG: AMP-binding protein [Limnochordaceae bacterium]|nr:AMP-binding protein [Limnochordaceae bacterium]
MREKDLGIWWEFTWADCLREVATLAAGLEALGFGQSDALVVMGDNRPQLYFGMLAASALRGYPTPIYPDAIPEEVSYIARSSGARFALVEDQEQVDKLLLLSSELPALETIVYEDPRGLAGYGRDGLLSYASLLEVGRRRLEQDRGLEHRLMSLAQPEDPAVLLHSSGTTGKPKGVVLRHCNVMAAVENAYRAGYFREGEEIVAYLPMAWVGDFTFSVAAAIALRFTVNIPERQETVLDNLREIGPTFYFAPPRSWDQLLTRIQVRMEESTPFKRWLYRCFVPPAIRAERERLEGRRPRFWTKAARAAGELLVYGPIKDQLGLSRVRSAYTAGEAIGEDTFVFFRALGVNLKQFYGQTENCALTAAQPDGDVRLHTVGKALPGVEVRVSEEGEILLRADSLFAEYLHDPEATRRAIRDGWFHTGDAGYVEPDGHLVVLGRFDEVVTTRTGQRFVPQYVENRLKFSPYVKEAAVFGAGKDFLAAIVCIDREAVGHWAELCHIAYTSYADLSQKPEVYDLIASVILQVNRSLPAGLSIRRFTNLHKEFDPDDGELTRTRKLRRRVIEERYRPIIEALYSDARNMEVSGRVVYEDGTSGIIRRTLAIRDVEDGAARVAHRS